MGVATAVQKMLMAILTSIDLCLISWCTLSFTLCLSHMYQL